MTVMHGGVERTFLLHVPASYDGKKLVPLVLDIHGYGGTAEYQKSTSGFREKSDEQGFLLAHPQGLNNSWNGGQLCCGQSLADKVDDEGFLRALVEKVEGAGCVNAKRVYATGLSNGGAMSHLLACHSADMFAAAAPISMSNSFMPCEPSRGISVTMFRATADELVPYDSPSSTFASAESDFTSWKERNACTGEAEMPNALCKSYANCKDGAEVTLCTVPTTSAADAPWGGHLLYAPAQREGVKIADFVWAMFERHSL
jgi:polyhydroxybutyrate depolymerase